MRVMVRNLAVSYCQYHRQSYVCCCVFFSLAQCMSSTTRLFIFKCPLDSLSIHSFLPVCRIIIDIFGYLMCRTNMNMCVGCHCHCHCHWNTLAIRKESQPLIFILCAYSGRRTNMLKKKKTFRLRPIYTRKKRHTQRINNHDDTWYWWSTSWHISDAIQRLIQCLPINIIMNSVGLSCIDFNWKIGDFFLCCALDICCAFPFH